MPGGKPDYTLYLVTDRGLSLGRPLKDVVLSAVSGGVTCVQLREKDSSSREFLDLARKLREALSGFDVPLIINDRLDIALACGADGVHLGPTDMPLEDARRILGEDRIIGISASSVQAAVEAERGGADYIGVSPVFPTPTKEDTSPALGLPGLREMRKAVRIPLVGIGGLNSGNAADVTRCGADGIAVVSAIMSAPDPEQAARRIRKEIRKAAEE